MKESDRERREELLADLRNLDLDRRAVCLMEADLEQFAEDRKQKGLSAGQQRDLEEKCEQLETALRLTRNHIGRMERLLQQLDREEQRIVELMLIRPYSGCAFDLQDELKMEKSCLYRHRADAISRLLRLRYGAAG